MRSLLIAIAFFAAWATIDYLPAPLATILGLIILAGIFAGLVALGVKWVRNV